MRILFFIILFIPFLSFNQKSDTLFKLDLGYIHYGRISDNTFLSNETFIAVSHYKNDTLVKWKGKWTLKNDTIKIDSAKTFDENSLIYYYPKGFSLVNILRDKKIDTVGAINGHTMNGCTVSWGSGTYLLSNNLTLNYTYHYQHGSKTTSYYSIGKWRIDYKNKILYYDGNSVPLNNVDWVKKS